MKNEQRGPMDGCPEILTVEEAAFIAAFRHGFRFPASERFRGFPCCHGSRRKDRGDLTCRHRNAPTETTWAAPSASGRTDRNHPKKEPV